MQTDLSFPQKMPPVRRHFLWESVLLNGGYGLYPKGACLHCRIKDPGDGWRHGPFGASQ